MVRQAEQHRLARPGVDEIDITIAPARPPARIERLDLGRFLLEARRQRLDRHEALDRHLDPFMRVEDADQSALQCISSCSA
jgi:hypothetical protein